MYLFNTIRSFIERVISFTARVIHIDLLRIAHRNIGILRGGDFQKSGEVRFLESTLVKLIGKDPLIFDVGANKGKYSEFLSKTFPEARILSFEPNPFAFKELEKCIANKQIEIFNFGFSKEARSAEMLLPSEDKTTERGSLYGNKSQNTSPVISTNIRLETIDDFSIKNNINRINFLKIDVEGHELDVLKGAKNMLTNRKIDVIQFEFSVLNIETRVFIKDFYELLKDYEFHRITKRGLYPLSSYNPAHEIFRIQNIVAILRQRDK